MRLIYTDGFGTHERKVVRQVIFSNMVVAFKIIGEEMRDLGLDYEYGDSLVLVAIQDSTSSTDKCLEV